ncbi:MAG: carbohydrate ABC transporter permease [bacterium]
MSDVVAVYQRGLSWKEVVAAMLFYAILLCIAAVVLVPFLWMFSTSLKVSGDVAEIPPRWIPPNPAWGNFREVLIRQKFLRFGANSITIATLDAVGQLFTCSLAGFAFARLRFRGQKVLFAILLATMMIPMQVVIIPEFLIMLNLSWLNTFLPLVVPPFLVGSFGTFMLRQFFMNIPRDLEDAARIDGCSTFGVYFRIFLPLAKPALATLFIFAFMNAWNDLIRPIIYLTSKNLMTLTIGLASFSTQYNVDMNLVMAGAVVTLTPLVVLYAFAQRYFVQGITMTGLK